MGAAERQIQAALATLGYSPKWLEYGFLNENALMEQIACYQRGEDRNTEHYRYAAFCRVLAERPALDDASVDRYIELAEEDEDPGMARAALVDLLIWPGLTGEQFDRLSRDPRCAEPIFQKFILRRRLLSALQSAAVSAATFDACLSSKDQAVQRELAGKPELSAEQLERLGEDGVVRAVRNMATAQLRRRTKAARPLLAPLANAAGGHRAWYEPTATEPTTED